MDLVHNIEADAAGAVVKITDGVQQTQYELLMTFRKIQDKAREALRAMCCRFLPDVQSQGSAQASTSYPCQASTAQDPPPDPAAAPDPTTVPVSSPMSAGPFHQAPQAPQFFPFHGPFTSFPGFGPVISVAPSAPPVVPPYQTRPPFSGFHTSTEPGPSQLAHDGTGFVSGTYFDENMCFSFEDLDDLDDTGGDGASDGTQDILRASQLGGAPPPPTQDATFVTPPASTRPARASRPASRLTYSEDHVRAKRGRDRRGVRYDVFSCDDTGFCMTYSS